ncbi:hypothetical protein KUTeg_023934 [Tegillarca granosa]|uniref:F-BAR and double SH3 domains protein 2 n=1 Tax=Tegillarca granosa TaxID=220873 RepID=A0ABQ9E2A1_TEGGR|nr:hypothetical protein KUTeg_023934 [Tegillarca granosa]
MQPPPRKVKHSTALKNLHNEQVSKLQTKHQQELDLLEDIRTYCRQRSLLEKEYGQSLLKLTTTLLKRDFPATPDLSSEDGQEHKTALGVWRFILEESEKLAKAKLQAAEILMEQIAEPIKPLKASKIQCQKKVTPQLTLLQQEVAQSVLEMTKTQKTYNIDENLAYDARLKATEANDKLAKKSTGIFTSLASLQKNCAKLNSRKDTCEAKSTLSRNEYLLNMTAANAHQIRYYSTDLSDLMMMVRCLIKYENIFPHSGKALLDISTLEKEQSENFVTQAEMIDRQFNHQCFLYCNRVFTDLVQYQFEPCRNDQISESSTETASHQDVEQKIEEMKQHIRVAETAKLKAEARIEMLRNAGVNVDEWIASAQAESLRAEEDEMTRTPSQGSLRTESSGGKSDDLHEPTYTHYDDDDDFIDDTFEVTKDSSFGSYGNHSKYPLRCKAIYDFVASNSDELDMTEGEELEIIADGEGDGWVKGRNLNGEVGYIPENYIETYNINDNADTNSAEIHSPPAIEIHSPESTNDITQEVTSYSSGDMEVQMATSQMDEYNNPVIPSEGCWARALYDYEACSNEELTFTEGTLIKIIRKDENGVDDGFWEGEINGKVGVFPSLVVEELGTGDDDDVVSPERPGAPDFVPPPPVTITAATPETEHPPSSISLANGSVEKKSSYSSSHRVYSSSHYRRRSSRPASQSVNPSSYESTV